MRIGIGYDVHKLVKERPLILGGVEIPYEYGLFGHSDADVLTHAIMDALLGAAGMGDIGRHFPDDASEFKDISSLLLLRRVIELLAREHYHIINIDSVIIAQKPKLAPYIPDIERSLAECAKIDHSCINVKATTEEGLGFTGSGEGIFAQAVCLIERAQIRRL